MNVDLLTQYENAMRQKRALEALIETLKQQVIAEVRNNGECTNAGNSFRIASNTGNFIVTKYNTYKFSPAVDRLALELKQLKEKEIANKIATATEKEMVMYKQL